MKIVFNALGYDSGKSGISKYMLNSLDYLYSKHDVVLVCEERDREFFTKRYNAYAILTFDKYCQKTIVSLLVSFFIVPLVAFFYQAQLIFLPAINRRVIAFRPCKVIGIIHDLSQFHIENKYDGFRMFYVKKLIPYFITRYEQLICVSQSTKNDVIKFWNIQSSKLDVAHLGFNKKQVKLKKLKKDSILYVSRLEYPGKNHVSLLRAYSMLPKAMQDKYDLVFVGEEWSGHEKIYQEIDKLGLKDNVVIKGFVSSKELEECYMKSELFVYPSFYEGFGIPLLEAMNYEIPIVCSTAPALVEVGANAVDTFSPKDPVEMADKFINVLEQKNKRERMVEEGKKRLLDFSWEKHFAQYSL